jgi:hypothetical protein
MADTETTKGRILKITCDQVAWMLSAINRYLPSSEHPAVSRAREMKSYGLLYEIMEVAGLEFADQAARYNGTPRDARGGAQAPSMDDVDKAGWSKPNPGLALEQARRNAQAGEDSNSPGCAGAAIGANVGMADAKGLRQNGGYRYPE